MPSPLKSAAPTIFQAGVKENVLPSRAAALVNFRLLAGDSSESITKAVETLVRGEGVTVRPGSGGTLSEPSPVSDTRSEPYRRLARSMRDLLDIVDIIQAQGAGFRSLAEDNDTTPPAGWMKLASVTAIFSNPIATKKDKG